MPGKASLHGFQQLKKLQYPLELVMCNVAAAGVTDDITASFKRFLDDSTDSFVSDLIPASVALLSIISNGTDHHEQALDTLFRRFHLVRKYQLPAMQEIYIACPGPVDKAHKQCCNEIVTEAGGEGVAVHLQPFETTHRLYWEGDPEL